MADTDDAHSPASYRSADGPADGPNVSLVAVSVPGTVANGSDYRLEVELDNDADTSVSVTLKYDLEGHSRGRMNRRVQTVTVPPGGTNVTVNLTAPTEAGSTVEHHVAVAGEEWTGETRVRSPARFVPSITGMYGSLDVTVVADDGERTELISIHATPTRTPTATATPAERSTTSTVMGTGSGTETGARTTVTPRPTTDDRTPSPAATTRRRTTTDTTSGEATPGFDTVGHN